MQGCKCFNEFMLALRDTASYNLMSFFVIFVKPYILIMFSAHISFNFFVLEMYFPFIPKWYYFIFFFYQNQCSANLTNCETQHKKNATSPIKGMITIGAQRVKCTEIYMYKSQKQTSDYFEYWLSLPKTHTFCLIL